VPIHPAAHAGGQTGNDYHYLVALPPADVIGYYEDSFERSGWEAFAGTLTSGSSALFSYTRDGQYVYVSPRDGGSLVSIVFD